MLGFTPIGGAPLGAVTAPTPIILVPVTGVQASGQAGVLGFTTVQTPTQAIVGIEATAELTDQPLASQPASVSITGFGLTVEDDIKPVTLVIGSYVSLLPVSEHTAELGTLPLTGLTRVIEVITAGELTPELGVVGLSEVALVTGEEVTGELGTAVASISISTNISGIEATEELGTPTFLVNCFVYPVGVEAPSEITRLIHVPAIAEVTGTDTDSFEPTVAVQGLANVPVVTIIETGFDNTLQTNALGNIPVVEIVAGFGPATFVGNLGNTPVTREILGVEVTGEINDFLNDPAVALTTGTESIVETGGLANRCPVQVVAGFNKTLGLGELDNESVITILSGNDATQELADLQNMPIPSDSVSQLIQVSGLEGTGEVTAVRTSRNPSALLYPWEAEAQLGSVTTLTVSFAELSGSEVTVEVGSSPTVSLLTSRVISLTGIELTNSLGSLTTNGIVVDFSTLAQNFEIARNVKPEALANRKVFPSGAIGSRRLAA
tara:strand:+ start:7337 stop:8818 length:1482 start_codon:yes stop_codon:yes gene_type:complete